MEKDKIGGLEVEFLRRLVHELDMAKFFHIAAEGMASLLGADGTALIVKEEPDLLRYWFFHGLPPDYKHLSIYAFNDRLGVAGEALRTRKPVLVTNYPQSPYALSEYVKTGLHTSLCSPVRAGGEIIAILAIAWFSPPERLPQADDYRILEIVSDFIGAALHRFHTEQRLRDLAMHDPLTGSANRNLFFNRLEHAMSMALRRDRLLALIIFDIDNFKMINDRFGHSVGDSLLIEVRRRLQDLVRKGDTLARLGGDEFALLLEDVRCYHEVETVIERIRQSLRLRWGSHASQIAVTVSLGATVFPIDDGDGEALVHNADVAMYEAKRAGGNRALLFSDTMAVAHARQSDLILEFRAALDRGEMQLYFQPIIEIATGVTVSAEALLRWNHPTRGILAPPDFMVAIEHPYNSVKLDQWVVLQAVAVLARWQARGIFKTLHINLSTSSIEDHRFCETVRRAVAQSVHTVDIHYLGIELVEWSTIQDIEAARNLITDCRALGISVALDDFGTGYASLQHLRLLPINSIKIDRSFVMGSVTERTDRILIQSMLSAAKAFEIEAIAEGIETEEQRALLATIGCVYGQGYLFSRPVPEETFYEHLR